MLAALLLPAGALRKVRHHKGRAPRGPRPWNCCRRIAEIIGNRLVFVAVMTALLVALILVASKMPDGNPLKRLLAAPTHRVGTTAPAGALAIRIEPIPGIDAVYDLAVPVVLAWYWFTLLRDAWLMSNASASLGQRRIARDDR